MWMFCGLMLTWAKKVSCIHRRYECGSSPAMGKYSSRLNVTTEERSSPSSLCMRMSSRYIPTGVDPVARPSTAGLPAAMLARTSRSTSWAACLEASAEVWKTSERVRAFGTRCEDIDATPIRPRNGRDFVYPLRAESTRAIGVSVPSAMGSPTPGGRVGEWASGRDLERAAPTTRPQYDESH